MALRLGIDVGGTFTDFLLLDEETGETHVAKVSSTPADPSQAIVTGIERVCARAGVAPGEVAHIVHGTTVATNTVLEGRGARVGLVTTDGFREILHLGRGETPGPLAGWITMIKPDPLADLEDTFEADERLDSSGTVVVPLDGDHLRDGLRLLYDRGVESLTVSLLHSYANQVHERRAAEIAREVDPAVPVTLASDVVSEFREYERTQTAVINAYIKPRLRGYLRDLEERLAGRGFRADVTLLRSDSGMMSLADAAERPINALLSGPAGGVAGAVSIARAAGYERILSFDMGGTSTDCCLSLGTPSVSWETKVGPFPVKIPSVEIATVGAGGGSIAQASELTRALRVGPRSAGAVPGPACYGRGGVEATVTDANVVLGYLPPRLLDGEIELDVEAAREAVGRVADATDLDLHTAAHGVIQLVNEEMLGALRVVSVERGLDPRDFCLVAFGGAGPMHANALAHLLDAWPVLVPPAPGVLSALGAAVTEYRNEFVFSVMRRLSRIDLDALERRQEESWVRAEQWLAAHDVAPVDASLSLQYDMRYYRQGLELPLDVARDFVNSEGIDGLRMRFGREHERLYGFALDTDAEIVNVRVTAAGRPVRLEPRALPLEDADATEAAVDEVETYFADDPVATAVYDRKLLRAGNVIAGPAIITSVDATTLVLPGCEARVDRHLNILIRPLGRESQTGGGGRNGS